GVEFIGRCGEQYGIDEGQAAARLCALNVLAQVKAALGSLEKVRRCLKLTGFVNSTPDFTDHPKVINGASDIMIAAFGEKGRHARAAVGVASLPLGVAVEVEAIFEVE
ncbi:MAG: RidA family protein, partial [Flavobacteriaceae bacterium]